MFIIMGAVCLSWLTNHIWTHTLIQKAFDVILKGRKVTNFAQVHIAHLDVLLIVHPFLFLKQTKKSCFQAVIFSWKENGCHSCWCQIFCTHWQESPQFLFQSTNRCFSKFLLVDIKGVKSCPKRCGKKRIPFKHWSNIIIRHQCWTGEQNWTFFFILTNLILYI